MPGRIHLTLTAALGAGAVVLGAAGAAGAMRGGSDLRGGAVIKNTDGTIVGALRIDGAGAGRSRVTVSVKGLPEGFHGFHIHAKGVCDPSAPSPFTSAGGHFDLGTAAHSHHSGDLPTLLVAQNGTANASVVTDRFRVQQLFDADGSAVIIHALPDNHANIPNRYLQANGTPGPDAETLKAGDSGGRISCGVITQG